MLELRILQPADQHALEAFLLPRLVESMILLGNSRVAGLQDGGQRFQGTYAAALQDGVILAVAAHYWNGNTVLQAPEHAAALCRYAVRESRRALAGVLGPSTQVGEVLSALGIARAQLQLDSVESLFRLPLAELRVPPALRSGAVQVRAAQPRDLATVTRFRTAYCVEALRQPDTPELFEHTQRTIAVEIAEGRVWLAEVDGEPVAKTAFNSAAGGAVQVGGVFTPKPLRGRGYARAAVAQSLLDARAKGADTAVLFTGDDNLAAQRAYTALGFERIGDYRISTLHDARPAAGF